LGKPRKIGPELLGQPSSNLQRLMCFAGFLYVMIKEIRDLGNRLPFEYWNVGKLSLHFSGLSSWRS